MNRKLVLIVVTAIVAPLVLASPPPKVKFVFHNKTGVPLTDVVFYTNYTFPFEGSRGSGAVHPVLGTIAKDATATYDFKVNFEQKDLSATDVSWTANGQKGTADYYYSTGAFSYWGTWRCTTCAYKYLMQWDDYTINFYLQKP